MLQGSQSTCRGAPHPNNSMTMSLSHVFVTASELKGIQHTGFKQLESSSPRNNFEFYQEILQLGPEIYLTRCTSKHEYFNLPNCLNVNATSPTLKYRKILNTRPYSALTRRNGVNKEPTISRGSESPYLLPSLLAALGIKSGRRLVRKLYGAAPA